MFIYLQIQLEGEGADIAKASLMYFGHSFRYLYLTGKGWSVVNRWDKRALGIHSTSVFPESSGACIYTYLCVPQLDQGIQSNSTMGPRNVVNKC